MLLAAERSTCPMLLPTNKVDNHSKLSYYLDPPEFCAPVMVILYSKTANSELKIKIPC